MADRKKTTEELKKQEAIILPPAYGLVEMVIEGTSHLVTHAFSPETFETMKQAQEAGAKAKAKKQRKARDFDKEWKQAIHVAHPEGWQGIHAGGIRAGMISACRTVGFVMTRAKLAFWCLPDGYTKGGAPLVKITKGKPKQHMTTVRLATGVVDLRSRPMWEPGWRARLRIRFDTDMLAPEDIGNLVSRVGAQVGIGEGRNDSKQSAGMGWGFFRIVETKELESAA